MKKSSLPSSIGDRLALVRGLVRQEDFAARLGVSRNTLIRYEKGERSPDALFLAKLASEFGVDLQWLLTGEGFGHELSPREAALLDNYRHCPDDAQRSIETTSALLAQRGGAGAGVKKAG